MFAYLRLFSIASLAAVLVAAFLLGTTIRSIATQDMKTLAEKSNLALAQGFTYTIWQYYRSQLTAPSMALKEWKTSAEYGQLGQSVRQFIDRSPIIRLRVYTPGGELIYANQEQEQSELLSAAMLLRLQAGESLSEVLEDAPWGNGERRTIVQTLVPILSQNYGGGLASGDIKKIDGVVEFWYDVTPQWRKLSQFQWLAVSGITGVFLALIAVFLIMSKKAEALIARQHEANLELTAAAVAAEAANREKSQFLANISHELRTPLNAIIGFSEIIKTEMMGAVDNDRYQGYINDIHASGVHLLSLINDILDYSKAEAGKLELEIAEVDAIKAVINCMRLVSPRAESAGVTLTDVIPKGHFVLKTDAKKLKQILLNLLSNAVKFTSSGGEVRVTVWQNVVDDSISIEVRDTGIGIAPKDISRAMAPFGQVDSALSRRYEGTGLGLPLTRKFVEIMGGKFAIQSEVNVGTTVTVTFPRECPHPAGQP